jgi:hypothetical protein
MRDVCRTAVSGIFFSVSVSCGSRSLKSFGDISGLWEFVSVVVLKFKRAWIFNIHPLNHTESRYRWELDKVGPFTVRWQWFFDLYLSR